MSTTTVSTPVPVVIATPAVSPPSPAASSAASIGLSPIKVCADGASVAEVIAVLISQRFAVDSTLVDALKAEMVSYFDKAGVTNEHIFSFITEFKSWPDVNKAGPRNHALKQISVPVVLLLTNLAKYTDKMLLAGFFLSDTVSYNDFSSWITSLSTPSTNLGSVGSPQAIIQ